MKVKKVFIALAAAGLLMTACQTQSHREAQAMLDSARMACDNQRYQEALNTIERLRSQYPDEIEVRKEALKLFQDASLKMAQADIAVTDSALQATTAQMQAEQRIYERNMLGVKKDSLQARYEALIGVVRMIRKRMDETQK